MQPKFFEIFFGFYRSKESTPENFVQFEALFMEIELSQSHNGDNLSPTLKDAKRAIKTNLA